MLFDRTWHDLGRTGMFLLALGLVGLIAIGVACPGNRAIAIVVALSWGAVGGIVGFLFAVPRVRQEVRDKQKGDQVGSAANVYQMHVNTNLEEISDWLTKIIVGIGLSQISNLPSLMSRATSFLGPGFGGPEQGRILAMSAIIYFVGVGYLSGYLLTRIYLAGAFRRADAQVVSGVWISNAELRVQQSRLIEDIQNQFIDLKSGSLKEGPSTEPSLAFDERIAADAVSGRVSSILWVDDNPTANVLMTERLQRIDVDVICALSTEQALRILSGRRFDRVISNMARTESGKKNPTAGLDLLREVRQRAPETPFAIFCEVDEVSSYYDIALGEGATVVTASPITLLDTLNLESR